MSLWIKNIFFRKHFLECSPTQQWCISSLFLQRLL
ncbi:hypothetical protein NC651_017486 [Populus alba x Populus x berolinensis]|nr:hypothetical protein NC651_015922 [Populus alba x Populus x berolinensis]KAJ6915067.1 hypothetical protein NC651_017138 [Populus alba x Populus x berolinensis]KAJ6915077.1 hypothetical protein NC651_017146 [Populus alba x Populus x berolinensis]KAJ6915501.1 hypothetical protein NC651_017486 [Populus alba x Populus x berolinensis]